MVKSSSIISRLDIPPHSTGLSVAYFGLSQGSSKSSGHASFMPTTLPLLQVLVVTVVSSGHASVMSTTLPSSQVLVVTVVS